MAGAVCGGISTGTDKIRSGYGNGDCLYFDFEHMVFAVADGTERFPWASRDLLNRLSESLAKSGTPDTAEGWKELINTRGILGAEIPAQDDLQLRPCKTGSGRRLPDYFARRRQRGDGHEQRDRYNMPPDPAGHEFRRKEQEIADVSGIPGDGPEQQGAHIDGRI